MVEFATSHLEVPVVRSSFGQLEPERPFDAITMWDYIEHSIDARQDLETGSSNSSVRTGFSLFQLVTSVSVVGATDRPSLASTDTRAPQLLLRPADARPDAR